ncbi:MAG: hypothetical protein ABJH21_10970, partial [Parasphingorhabdus sp.]
GVGLCWLIDEAFNESYDINIAGDYYVQATSDDYRTIYRKETDFTIPMRVDWYQSDTKYIVAIRKQEANLDRRYGPCEYYVIDHVNALEDSKLTQKEARDLLQYQHGLNSSFDHEVGKRCNPVQQSMNGT